MSSIGANKTVPDRPGSINNQFLKNFPKNFAVGIDGAVVIGVFVCGDRIPRTGGG